MSSSGDSLYSLSASDSKYPSGLPPTLSSSRRGVVAYAYDPLEDSPHDDQDDFLHDHAYKGRKNHFPWRGVLNVSALLTLITALLLLFIFYPVRDYIRNRARSEKIVDGNTRINATGQAPDFFSMPTLIDKDTPEDVKSLTGFDGQEYELVFSDEFNQEGRTFYPGDDPYWEAVDIWYGVTGDLEWYDPSQVTTVNGALRILMEDTGPPDPTKNHGLQYKSGMLQSWNKFCFSSGYIEVAVTFPGTDQNAQGYWPGVWTMGNLGRPGYIATTDGMWPYTYDSCDVGTFPNQTLRDRSGPTAALHSEYSRPRYNYELSWLPGQRLSACSCPGSDHPGPFNEETQTFTGRGAPEIDVLEASRSKHEPTLVGTTVSQSAQFAPFTADYAFMNEGDPLAHQIQSPERTIRNTYRGSAIQQSVSSLTSVPSDMFQGNPSRRFVKFGFEYWADPKRPEDGYVQWQVDGRPSHRMGAAAVAPDPNGSGVGQRLVPVEPMAIVLNNGISPNWQTIDYSTLLFPAEMYIDYVRVYQRKNAMSAHSISCDPPDFPTKKYIEDHIDMYTDKNATLWGYPNPVNRLYNGGC